MARQPQTATVSAIKDLILQRGLRPGDPMPTEAELMAELSVSRSSIREAIRTLVALDLIDVRHGTGTFVGDMSLRPLVESVVFRGVIDQQESRQTLSDVIQVRRALDVSLAAPLLAALATTDTADLRACVEAMVDAAEAGQPFTEHDRRFHTLLAGRLNNRLYTEMVTAFWEIHQSIGPHLGVTNWREARASADAHVALLDAAEASDVERYVRATHEHYEPLLRVIEGTADASAS